MPRLARYALIVCLLATAAAVVSFVNGSLLGVVWVLLAGLTSNMWWYYRRKAKLDEQQARARAAAEAADPAAAAR
jgi:Flp pilus assembly protein TadB